MAPDQKSLKGLVEKWLAQDRDPETRREIQELWDASDYDELDRRLTKRISFGTAGLRARMEAGFARMNCLTVIQASQGLAAYIVKTVPDAASKGVVIGRDARKNSDRFAAHARAAFEAAGLRVYCSKQPVHTPLVPFSVKHYGAAAGIMITASHNPKDDNGYKVYWGNGCQINNPRDKEIAASIDEHLDPGQGVWDARPIDECDNSTETFLALTPYLSALRDLVTSYRPAGATAEKPPRFVYTPLHGVGSHFAKCALSECFGIDSQDYYEVPSQAQPDAAFPTVIFPNPEEDGALDLALQEADRRGVQLVLANDPDADRFAMAEKDTGTGKWHRFSGNEVGILLAFFVATSLEADLGKSAKDDRRMVMLNTVVSTRMLPSMALKMGFEYRETLTGFKWLGNEALALEQQGLDVRFAFEEALGYMFPQVVHDKDGIAAMVMMLTACGAWSHAGTALSPLGVYRQCCQRFGWYADANSYLIRREAEVTNRIFHDIRERRGGSAFPSRLGNRDISHWVDLTEGYDSRTADHRPTLPVDASSQMIMFSLRPTLSTNGDTHVTIRGSGTEPKVKMYIETPAESRHSDALQEAQAVREDIIQQWMDPAKYNLRRPGEG